MVKLIAVALRIQQAPDGSAPTSQVVRAGLVVALFSGLFTFGLLHLLARSLPVTNYLAG
jgi:hypothetical protein